MNWPEQGWPIKVYPIWKRTEGVARHEKLQNRSPQKDCPKTWRTIWNQRSTRTCYLSAKTPQIMEDSQCLSRHASTPIYWKQNLWKQLPMTTSRASGRRRSLWSRNHPQTLEKRKRLPILHQIKGVPGNRSHLGKQIGILQWWRYGKAI